MSAKLADNALTTLEDVKIMLGIAPDDVDEQRDAMLVNLINYASAWIERMTGRKLGRQQYTQRYVASGTQELVLLQWPIINVEYVKDTTDGSIIPPEEYDYTVDGEIGVLYKDNGWTFRGYVGGLSYDFLLAARYLEVKYTAGYVLPKDATEDDPCTLPADLQGVVWGIIQQEFSIMQNGAQGLSAFSISDVSWTFDQEPARELAHDHWLLHPLVRRWAVAIIRDTLRPELERIKTELKALQALKIHVGIQGDADSYLLMIAGVHEYGATIRAKNVKNLAIPISREAEGKSPRDFQGLFFITSEEGHLFGVTDKGNGKFNFLFLLLPSVTIPERSFIRGSFDHGKNELAEACKAAIDKIVLEGGTAREAAALIGERAAAMTQAYIMKGIDPPKSSITMETTKSGKPLYSTGRLYQSITYEIEEG